MGWKDIVFSTDFILGVALTIIVIILIVTSDKKEELEFEFPEDGVTRAQEYKIKQKKKKTRGVNKSEEKTREIFQSLFQEEFKSIRPEWLKNPVTGHCLELDGFCPNISTPIGQGLAFEYDGKQHASFTPHFHRNGVNDFIYQVKKDSWKDKKCKSKGVLLIRIPHFITMTDLRGYIIKRLEDEGVEIPRRLPSNTSDDVLQPSSNMYEQSRKDGDIRFKFATKATK